MMKKRPLPFFLTALLFLLLCRGAAYAQWTAMNPVTAVQQQADGVLFTQASGTLKVQVCSDSVIRVLYSATPTFPKRPDFVVLKENWPAIKWTMQSSDSAATRSTSLLTVVVTRKDGAINYGDVNGGSLMQERKSVV